jgi:hypothetical protein
MAANTKEMRYRRARNIVGGSPVGGLGVHGRGGSSVIDVESEGEAAAGRGRGYFEGQSHRLELKNDDKGQDCWYHSGHFE